MNIFGKVVFVADYLNSNMTIKLQSTGIWDLTIKRKNIIFLVHSLLTTFYVPRLPIYASMSAATLSPYEQRALHVTWETKKILKQKILNLKPMKNHPTRQPIVISLIQNFSSLWFENISFSLSSFHHLHDPETYLKIPKNCLIWEKKPLIQNSNLHVSLLST